MNPHQKKANKNHKNAKNLNPVNSANSGQKFNQNPDHNNLPTDTKITNSVSPELNQKQEKSQNLAKIESETTEDKADIAQIKTQNEKNDIENSKIEKSNTLKSNKMVENIKSSTNSANNFINSPLLYAKLMTTFFLTLVIFGTVFVNGYVLPEVVLGQTDGAIAARTKKEEEDKKNQEINRKKAKLEEENKKLSFVNQKIAINIKDFGSLKINLKENAAPKTVENFVRLTSRGFFDGTVFHRMVESPTFSVIQGGDPTATGSGGETASGEPLVDEVWKVKPESNPEKPGEFLNTPEFTDPDLYKDFDLKTGQVTYPKGQILMAKTSAPDSATSQFFITLTDTILPAEYTIFGVLESESFAVLDKISKEVDPISSESSDQSPEYKDGKPNKELKIESAVIL